MRKMRGGYFRTFSLFETASPTTTVSAVMNDEQQDERLISRPEAAAILALRPNTLAVWATLRIYDVELPVVRIGRRTVRYFERDVIAFRDRSQSKRTHGKT